MNIILAAVISLDGKITRHNETGAISWNSIEDKKHFARLIAKSDAIIMGRKTYEAARKIIVLSPRRLRIVLTRAPEKYKKEAVSRELEFSKESPRQIIRRLQKMGRRKILIVGGGEIYALFLREGLVSRIELTIEPKIFGTGGNFLAPLQMKKEFRLVSARRLNRRGTLLLTYDVISTT
ncbi:hypothetical protein A3A21_00225 [Candidatus Jorgensenbacteria bacterium RIFCSPLOWO2_01_FULL_45_25b]|uniref:Bacterial bifunctional deaminase-reductase C-terminal domain-containing protein n=1 Tax=Candidatus Jorgensenbacteria bacterium RIFCSPLOWO2_01_FULL_45_25b TaxID=1798471 RepID=A0A1F6BRX9_9BACT|nr:MAG: hypothetical protein A3A21_00225 [Candidatus Jorgensenbacteria bacterium RIFCSPLOWO2_01_FULL_45_25b]